ncbi:hypothetical protein FRC10_003350 [Ceratobasidium sp. 414]|nr:hypothetical protein FRC10_003350 [Ceratobasidium sp. 414]
MSYASVAARNAPSQSQQPHPDQNLYTTQQDVSGGALPDVSRKVNAAPHDFKSNPHTATSEITPAHYETSDDEGTDSSKKHTTKERARRTLDDAEEEGLYLWNQLKERIMRPGTAGGLLGVVNVGLIAFAGREFYTKPHLRTDTRVVGTVAATTLVLLGVEGALAEAYLKTDAGKKEKVRARKEGAVLYRQTREVVLRPGVLGGLVGVLNLGILGGVGYAAYLHWDQPRWDRRAVSAVSAGLLTLAVGESYLGEKYVEKEHPKRK